MVAWQPSAGHVFNRRPHTWQGVPLVSVGDAVRERPAVSAAIPPVHGGVVVGVNLGQVDKHVVVGADAGPAHPLTP